MPVHPVTRLSNPAGYILYAGLFRRNPSSSDVWQIESDIVDLGWSPEDCCSITGWYRAINRTSDGHTALRHVRIVSVEFGYDPSAKEAFFAALSPAFVGTTDPNMPLEEVSYWAYGREHGNSYESMLERGMNTLPPVPAPDPVWYRAKLTLASNSTTVHLTFQPNGIQAISRSPHSCYCNALRAPQGQTARYTLEYLSGNRGLAQAFARYIDVCGFI